MKNPKVYLYIGIVIALVAGGAFGMYLWNNAREAKMKKEFNELTAERTKLQQENAQLAGANKVYAEEIVEIKTQSAAQEEIIKAKGGDMAVQQQKIEEAQKQFDIEEAASQVPTPARQRCETLKQKYIDLRVRGADKIDCSKL